MCKGFLVSCLGIISLVVPLGAMAESASGLTFALKYGVYDVKMPILGVSRSGLDSDEDYGVTIGIYDNVESSLELDYTQGNVVVSKGDQKLDVDASTLALFWSFRTKGQTYLISKLGYAKTEFEYGKDELDESFDRVAYGVGGGYKLTPTFSIEAEYTLFDDDVTSTTVAARWVF